MARHTLNAPQARSGPSAAPAKVKGVAPSRRVMQVRDWRQAVDDISASFLAAGRRMRAPLTSREFRLLWIGQAISQVGDPLQAVALAWLVLARTDSAVALSAALLALSVPR